MKGFYKAEVYCGKGNPTSSLDRRYTPIAYFLSKSELQTFMNSQIRRLQYFRIKYGNKIRFQAFGKYATDSRYSYFWK